MIDTASIAPPRIALVTGGSRGIGRSIATALAGQGSDIILTWRNGRAEAEAVVDAISRMGRRAVALQLDLGEGGTFEAFAERIDRLLASVWDGARLQALVNNAGAHAPAPFGAITGTDADALYAMHFKGPLFMAQALAPLLDDGGRIVNISSSLTRHTAAGSLVYASMKAAMEVMSRYLALELGPRGIAVNAVAPGATGTDFFGGAVRDDPQLNSHLAASTALGRTGVPDDIGAVVAALLAPGTGWLTGQRIEVSGGLLL